MTRACHARHITWVVWAAGCCGGWLEPAAVHAAGPAEGAGGKRPNILIIIADDLGYADLSCQGSKGIPTPRIDSLATNGIRFSNGYVSCPVCSPTRAGLFTGRYQQRFGHEFNCNSPPNVDPNFGLPVSEVTLADRLAEAGYSTGLVGKWHLGMSPRFHPLRRGFQEYFGFLHGSHPYFAAPPRGNPILRGTTPVEETEYLTDAFTREARSYLERHRNHPFFLCVTYNAVHTPLQVPEKYLARFAQIVDEKRRKHAAMVAALDDGVGALLDKLRETGLEERTLVFFLSDNGGPTGATTASNLPLRGGKGGVFEGGIRVPFFVQWKGRLPAGKVYDPPVIALDIFPTALAAAGSNAAAVARLDGVNLLPFLEEQSPLHDQAKGRPHDLLYWRFGERRAIRNERWKLIDVAGAPQELYDLQADVGEKNDLAGQQPEIVNKLAAALKSWDAELRQPLWPAPAPPRRAKRAPANEAQN